MLTTRLIAAALAFGSCFAANAASAEFPERPVTIVVPYAAGGATDIVARLLSNYLPESWSQPVLVENKPGAGTTVAAEALARSPGDGYTLFMTTAAHTISASLFPKLTYDPLGDFAAVTLTATIPLVLVQGSASEAQDLQQFLSTAEELSGSLTMGSPGYGSPQHLAGALYTSERSIEAVHVPYNGDSPMLTALMGGEIDFAFVTLSAVLPYLKSGELKALAVANAERIEAIPDVPTFAEAGGEPFEAATWFGMLAPASMPTELRERIAEDVTRIVSREDVVTQLEDMGGVVNSMGPADFEAYLSAESERWKAAVAASGASLE